MPYLLVAAYATTDGAAESLATYALCYRCHDRDTVLTASPFPEHSRHIVEIGASCATCHNGHGSLVNRALVRFGEETSVSGVSPSMATGRLEFLSTGPGSGTCYLSCHGADHAPRSYGTDSKLGPSLPSPVRLEGLTRSPRARPPARGGPGVTRR